MWGSPNLNGTFETFNKSTESVCQLVFALLWPPVCVSRHSVRTDHLALSGRRGADHQLSVSDVCRRGGKGHIGLLMNIQMRGAVCSECSHGHCHVLFSERVAQRPLVTALTRMFLRPVCLSLCFCSGGLTTPRSDGTSGDSL